MEWGEKDRLGDELPRSESLSLLLDWAALFRLDRTDSHRGLICKVSAKQLEVTRAYDEHSKHKSRRQGCLVASEHLFSACLRS